MNMISEEAKPMDHPGEYRSAVPVLFHHAIDHIDIHSQNVNVLQEANEKGHVWADRCRRKKLQNAVYHVRIYITRRKKYALKIEQMKTDVVMCMERLPDYRGSLHAFERGMYDDTETVLDDLKFQHQLVSQVSTSHLDIIFQNLVEFKMYGRDLAQSTLNQDYSILVLGDQSGKSTLIEFLSAYADLTYVIQEDNVGDGIFSKTDKAKTTTIHTDLPSYFVLDKAGKQVDYGNLIGNDKDQEDYEDELNERRKYQLKRGNPTATVATFNINLSSRRDSVPHLLIDNDIISTRVIRNSSTKNTPRELLAMAKLNQPVTLQLMVMNRAEKMRIIDNILKAKFEEIIATQVKTLGVKGQARQVVLATISELKDRKNKHDQHRQDNERDRCQNDRGAMGWLKLAELKTRIYYPEKKHIETPDFTSYVIDYVDTMAHNVSVNQPKGGQGYNLWDVTFRRNRFQNGNFHVKICIQKKKFAALLAELSEKDHVFRDEILVCERELKKTEQEREKDVEYMKELLEELQLNRYLHGRVSMSRWDSKVFHELVAAKVFVHQDADSAANLERFYIERRAELEKLDSDNKKYVDPAPTNKSAITDDGAGTIQDK
ncbi:hypothetical protein BG006_005901 [Podila minutissima]|uniref:Uncharacterized protein n=1 Tax=Podila minutissima TaxID=64525 RepID=A0A9P5VQN6_9FUNG|nr:hypothetical protein BG006_005901 [Podila minutissima]